MTTKVVIVNDMDCTNIVIRKVFDGHDAMVMVMMRSFQDARHWYIHRHQRGAVARQVLQQHWAWPHHLVQVMKKTSSHSHCIIRCLLLCNKMSFMKNGCTRVVRTTNNSRANNNNLPTNHTHHVSPSFPFFTEFIAAIHWASNHCCWHNQCRAITTSVSVDYHYCQHHHQSITRSTSPSSRCHRHHHHHRRTDHQQHMKITYDAMFSPTQCHHNT